jgi:hypothetical protein
MKTEPVANPAIVLATPVKQSHGDNAETNNFKNHKTGAGQRTRRKSVMLISAARQPEKAARI